MPGTAGTMKAPARRSSVTDQLYLIQQLEQCKAEALEDHDVDDMFEHLGDDGIVPHKSHSSNPLPRGKAIEGVDWVTDIYRFLSTGIHPTPPPGATEFHTPSIRMPLTLVLRYTRPYLWYSSIRDTGVNERKVTGDYEDIVKQFKAHAKALQSVATPGQQPPTEILAMYVSNAREGHGDELRISTKVEYFDEDLLFDFLRHRLVKLDGILQLFFVPISGHSQVRSRVVQSW